MSRALPSSASVAEAREGAKLHAPAAERNAEVIADFLLAHAPQNGRALEIASGTGQHVIRFAQALPDLSWQPTDVDTARLESTNAYAANVANVAKALHLDATARGWSADHSGQDLIVLINLLHLISAAEAQVIVSETAQALAPGGTFILYGPFSRDGVLTSEGDQRFDAQLRGADPAIGYKDTRDIKFWLKEAGLDVTAPFEMPANNLAFVSRKALP